MILGSLINCANRASRDTCHPDNGTISPHTGIAVPYNQINKYYLIAFLICERGTAMELMQIVETLVVLVVAVALIAAASRGFAALMKWRLNNK
ncbi:MAG TPA: hypothetical protein VKY59_03515 [Spirillospora sp.]|nr:hypothetical protein [Spirillospora sp.]